MESNTGDGLEGGGRHYFKWYEGNKNKGRDRERRKRNNKRLVIEIQ